MKKILSIALFMFIIVAIGFGGAKKVSADSFNSNNVIDDGIFDNSQSMSAAQINAFLNSQSNSCISPNSGFDAIDPTGYSPSTGYTFGGWTTAGQVIYDAAQAYQINPQVLLATLQKEQSLVQGSSSICNASNNNQYAAALGYACPDSGTTHSYTNVNLYERNGSMVTSVSSTCVDSASAVGFSQQLIRAAWLLKFGEQRSQGNVGWAIINANWNNSDDPQSCYGGPMTQGTFHRCPGGSSTYYDGYTTIDTTSVYMTNGATAALYWYTPHISGNQHFYNIFSNWFGSTTYSQPIDSMFVVGNQSGKAYFISLNNDTYYYIPTWSTVQAYGLDKYQAMPMNDSQIDSYTNGGTLTTLVWNNDDQKIYLVDHDTKYWFQQYCTQWGLDCLNQTPGDVTYMTSTYFDDILGNGGNSEPIQQYNGSLYLMQNGRKDPIANTATLLADGYNGSSILPINQGDLNSTQPLGPLQLNTPGFIEFPPSGELLYYDGTHYWFVPTYQMYEDWGSQSISVPVTSTYNITLPSVSGSLSPCVTDGSGNEYFINSGEKIDISADPSDWCSSFQTLTRSALSSLSTVASKPNVNINGAIYTIQNGTLRHVPSYNDYLWLGINTSNTLTLSPGAYSNFSSGPDVIADGSYFTVSGNGNLYVKNAAGSYTASTAIANDYGINWSNLDPSLAANVLSSGYPSAQSLTRWASPIDGSNLSYIDNLTRYELNTQVATDWGVSSNTVNPTSVDMALMANLPYTKNLGQFVQNEATGKVYFGSGGTYHFVASYATFVALGGNMSNLAYVYPDFFSGLTQGNTLN